MTLQSSYSHDETRPAAASRAAARTSADRSSMFTSLDMAGAVLVVIMIWGPLAAGAFLSS